MKLLKIYIFPFKYYSLNTFVFKRVVMNNYIQNNYFIIGNYLRWLALEIQRLSFTCFEWIHSHTHSLYNGEQLESRGASRPAWKFSATATRKMKCDKSHANVRDSENAARFTQFLPRTFTLLTHSLWAGLWCWCQGHLVWWMEGFPMSCPPLWSKGCFLHTHSHEPDSSPPVCERTKSISQSRLTSPRGLFLNC